jgi:alanyl-tRNA synthetase
VDELKTREKLIHNLEEKLALQEVKALQTALSAEQPVLLRHLKGYSPDSLKMVLEKLAKTAASHIILLAGDGPDKAFFMADVSEDFIQKGLKAGDLVKQAAEICGGSGGGRPNFAQAGGKDPSKIAAALSAVENSLQKAGLPIGSSAAATR